MGWAEMGTGCSRLGASGFLMEAGRATLRCGISSLSGSLDFWIQRLGAGGVRSGYIIRRGPVVWDLLVINRWVVRLLLADGDGVGRDRYGF